MTDPIISPDGKWMWTGSEWIPAPLTSAPVADSNLNLEELDLDFGDDYVSAESISKAMVPSIRLNDSAMVGDINVTQNNADDIAAAMVAAFKRLGFNGQSSPATLTPSQANEAEKLLEMSKQLSENDPWTELNLGKAAELLGRTDLVQQHLLRALEAFREIGPTSVVAELLISLGSNAYDEALEYYWQAVNFQRENFLPVNKYVLRKHCHIPLSEWHLW
jgi:tetratricopeptide (TPR) repeat protein